MKILMAHEVGFCFGVKRAINLAKQALAERDEVLILGDLIHNRAVSADLEARGLRKVDAVSDGMRGTMIVRAHGLPADQLEAAHAAGLDVVDATCPIVRQAQQAAQKLEERGCQVIIVGDANHPEIRGILGNLKGTTSHLVLDSVEEVRDAHEAGKISRRVGVVFQTTHSLELCQSIVNELMQMAREVQIINTICRPVRKRQFAAAQLAGQVDVMLVVGSITSANTMELKHLLQTYNPNTIQIENADQIDPALFTGDETVGIASGLSTPEDVVDQIRLRLQSLFPEPAPNLPATAE